MQNEAKQHSPSRQHVNLHEAGEGVNRFAQTLGHHALTLRHERTQALQINVGAKCNQTCSHCHVNAGPARSEVMTPETMNRIIAWLSLTDIPKVDITGGAPEINPNFRYLVARVKTLEPMRHIMDRCNLTILLEPGQEDLAEFLAHHRIEIIASLPCYSPANVDAQRGDGVFEKYQELLRNAFNPDTVAGLMCRTMLNVDWRGEVYDCDFNQMLGLQWRDDHPKYLWDVDPEQVVDYPVITGDHCFACTAGAGSSCGGALV